MKGNREIMRVALLWITYPFGTLYEESTHKNQFRKSALLFCGTRAADRRCSACREATSRNSGYAKRHPCTTVQGGASHQPRALYEIHVFLLGLSPQHLKEMDLIFARRQAIKYFMKNGLEKAYSSALKMDQRDHGRVVVKTVDAKERKNEIFFHERMRAAGLPSMNVQEEGDSLVLDFIEHAETLGDNETEDNYRSFGKAVRKMHAVKFDSPFYIDQESKQVEIAWEDFIKHCIREGSGRQNQRTDGLERTTVDRMAIFINASNIEDEDKSVLLHCDLHANNVLIKDQDVVLFDKGDQIVAGDPMYDLSLVVINLPGAVYKLGIQIEEDTKLLEAFIEGYGVDFTSDTQKLEAYILLRALERWPNPFEKEIPEIIKAILGNDQ